MRSFGFALAAAAAASWCAPVAAATMITTTSSCEASVPCNGPGTLQPFDPALGKLTGITLQIDAAAQLIYAVGADVGEGPSTAHLAYAGLFDALVNGVIYSVPISGSADITPAGLTADFFITGSSTFVVAPALFASFVGTADPCGIYGPGICASGHASTQISDAAVIVSQQSMIIERMDHGYFGAYTLTYDYRPASEVPEPASWALMLLGFGAIGLVLRRRSHLAQLPVHPSDRSRVVG